MVIHLLAFAFMGGVAAGGAWAALRVWRNAAPTMHHRSPIWPGGEIAWRAFVRQCPVGCATLIAGLLAYLFGVLIPAPQSGWPQALMTAFGLAALVLVAFSVSIALFNRPRLLVPPHLRGERGWIADHLAGLRARDDASGP